MTVALRPSPVGDAPALSDVVGGVSVVGFARGGAGTALVGNPDKVARRMKEYMALGIDRFILSGYSHLEEFYRFAELVFPKLPLKATTGRDRGPARNDGPFGEIIANVVAPSPSQDRGRELSQRSPLQPEGNQTSVAKEIRLNAFDMNCVVHQSPGLWRHPRDRSRDYRSLRPWIDLARTLERGLFDGLFLADVLGVYDVFGGSAESALRHATQVPVNDPLLLVPAMAAATEHLGFGVTVTLSYEPPFPFARRMSTLDHLTDGRVGWNVVTGYLDSAARGMGAAGQRAHDDRYAVADDYMQVVYKLWEGSWANDAVRADAATGVFADPARVRRVTHDGPHYRLDALHLSEPSPQRTPVLYQAGTSPAGRSFAGRHAECVFMSGPSKAVIAPRVAAIRQAAIEAGRAASDILTFAMMTVIVADTDEAAQALLGDYRRYADPEGALTLMSGWTGVDFSTLDPDQVVEHVPTEAGRSALENITRADPGRRWTVREVAEHVSIGGISPVIVGSARTVADQLESWIDETGLDGFNLAFAVRPETFEAVVDLLVPELQQRGRYKRAYAPGPLRQKLFGRPRLAATHPGHAFRFS